MSPPKDDEPMPEHNSVLFKWKRFDIEAVIRAGYSPDQVERALNEFLRGSQLDRYFEIKRKEE